MRSIIKLMFTLFCILGFAAHFSPNIYAASDCRSKGKVLAFYYGWYASPPFDNGDWVNLSGRLGDNPKLGAYASESVAIIHQHVDEARAHGIDGFILSWVGSYPGDFGANKSDMVLSELLSYSASLGDFCVAVNFEPLFMRDNLGQSNAQIIAHMNYLLSTYGKHQQFLKIAGKPAVFFWKNEHFDDGFWRSMRSSIKTPAYFISEAGPSRNCINKVNQGLFDNCYFYSVFWKLALAQQEYVWDNISTQEAKFGTITPGYNDGKQSPTGRWANGSHTMYVQHWEFILRTLPDYVLITSYNEWPEATYIERSNKFGDLYLRITKEGSDKYRAKL